MSFANKFRNGFKHWFAVEATPIYIIMAGVVGGAGWYLVRLAKGPTVVWTKNNPTPWNDIKQDEATKIINMNTNLNKSWSRDKF
ncbi:hypothetical protein BDV98DRAFT_593977 [Pterulicium gracile]|uniref:NADH-ubiquinone reductase complex 1 MLRQ subunit-domain-containing protein n=1 Tax=Pterulicium gracile TaxID=1884261 RepID=A0A5C3QF29_9AGAR|nr:hypothetical protein BDV98DRAFT_593977 [Pterula gracilis]